MKLTEGSLLTSISLINRYSARDIADLTFLYMIALHILRVNWETIGFAKNYASKTMSYNIMETTSPTVYVKAVPSKKNVFKIHTIDDPENELQGHLKKGQEEEKETLRDFEATAGIHVIYMDIEESFSSSSTDLSQLLTITLQHSDDFIHLKNQEASKHLLHDLLLNSSDVKKFLRNVASSSYDDKLAARLLLHFERDLRVTVTNYKSVRRISSDWNTSHIDDEAKSLSITRLLQAMKHRAIRGDLLQPLQNLAKQQKLELTHACNPETGENCNIDISPDKYSQKLSMLKQLTVAAGFGVGAYYLGKALAGGFKNGSNIVREDATCGATSSGSVASVANPVGTVLRRPSLFGYVPETPENLPKKRKKRKTYK